METANPGRLNHIAGDLTCYVAAVQQVVGIGVANLSACADALRVVGVGDGIRVMAEILPDTAEPPPLHINTRNRPLCYVLYSGVTFQMFLQSAHGINSRDNL